MIRLEMTEQEAEVLRDVIEWRLRELSHQISHTDHAAFRERLKGERSALERVLESVGTPRAA